MRLGLTRFEHSDIAAKCLAPRLGIDFIVAPPTTRRTLSLGVRYSPEAVCLPFKLQLGNMIEVLEEGADTLMMPGSFGPCRFGYYQKLQRRILHELGYQFELVSQENGIMHMIRRLTNDASLPKLIKSFHFGAAKLKMLESFQRSGYKTRAVEINKGETTAIFMECVRAIDRADDYRTLGQVRREYERKFKQIPAASSSRPLKIGITGEFYLVIDSFANMELETELGNLGAEISRSIHLSDWVRLNPFIYLFGLLEKHKSHRAARPYVTFHIGGDAWQSVGENILHARDWDGIVHVEPFGCMPEITARNIVPSIKEGPPVLNIIYDEHTGKAGVINRLEAFVEMLKRKRKYAV